MKDRLIKLKKIEKIKENVFSEVGSYEWSGLKRVLYS